MASVNSLSGSSSSSSIYGNRSYNIISGLASGLDTEELISGLVQSYQQKIQSLQNKNTKYQWQQQAIQSISDKLVEFDRNYSSYIYSDTNLSSSSFFNNAVKTTTNGTNSALVSASGKSSSDIVLNAVRQLASSARYTSTKNIAASGATGSAMKDLDEKMPLSKLSGSLTLSYGTKSVSIDFDNQDLYVDENGDFDAAAYQKAIEDKLSEQKITTSSGSSVTADSVIGVSVDSSGNVSFTDKSGGGNNVYVSSVTGSLKDMISGVDSVIGKKGSFSLSSTDVVDEDATVAEYLDGKSITVTLDGQSKTIKLPSQDDLKAADPSGSMSNSEKFAAALQTKLNDAFGDNRITVGAKDGALSFSPVGDGSTVSVTSSDSGVAAALGMEDGLTSYVDTTKTLSQLGILTSGKQDLVINGVKIGTYDKDTELNTIINDINSNTEAGVNVTYSKTTNQFVFTAKDTGAGGRIEIAAGGLGDSLFGATLDEKGDLRKDLGTNYSEGLDAKISATINGQTMELTRSSNSFDLDGMNITLNGTFEAKTDADKVTFTSKMDADTIVDAVKKMVDDMNTIIKEVKNAYSTMPLEKNDGSRYEPLTDEDKEDMSDSAIETYEEKAKTGILFMDRDLSSLYNDLRNAISVSGSDGATLRSMGISTSYSDGLTTITFDEKAFREALESDPDKVQEAFTKSTENGAATDGLMATFKKITDKYASPDGDVKGVLIEKAGSKYSPSAALDNTLLNQMKDIEDQISEWQDKMSNKVDYYTNKFTQLEMLMNQMNSQSSALAGLMGG